MDLDELGALLMEHKPYTNEELLILFSILIGISVKDLEGKSYELGIGIFQFEKDIRDKVSIGPVRAAPYAPAESQPFKDALSNEVFCGIYCQFKRIPLYVNSGGHIMNKMVQWRLTIGR